MPANFQPTLDRFGVGDLADACDEFSASGPSSECNCRTQADIELDEPPLQCVEGAVHGNRSLGDVTRSLGVAIQRRRPPRAMRRLRRLPSISIRVEVAGTRPATLLM